MHLIFCIDDRDGISFCGRRLSQDRELVDHMLQITADHRLWMSPYSSKLFPVGRVIADPAYLARAEIGDYCFVEKGPLPKTWENVESVTLYHWNRAYPSTERFPRDILEGMLLDATEEFPGHSHETITMERFVK